MLDLKQLWETCLFEIKNNVSPANFSTWFKETRILKEDGGVLYIAVPNEFVKKWLCDKFHKLIIKTLMTAFVEMRGVEYVISKPLVVGKIAVEFGHLPLQDLYVNKEDNLNPRYRFGSFIVGPFNDLAYAAAQAIINMPGKTYNPFFVYGRTGLGKTHLIQAIGNEIKDKTGKKIIYASLEHFSMDYVSALQKNKTNSFKEKYRKYDVLIMDDIQFISGREKVQEELFHLFNNLYEAGKQIVFSSDKHPNYIPGLEERLKTRFGAGMIVDISEPDFESRLAILKSRLRENDLILPEEIIDFVAKSIVDNIRELEGCLNTVICQTQLKGRDLNLNEVRNLIKNSVRIKKSVSIKDIVKTVADFYNLEDGLIYEKTRRREVVKARQVVMYILREEFSISYPLIGQKLGGKDHTTVIHSCLKIKNSIKSDHLLNQELEQIKVMFK
ncbi:MAG TPA: chromosomal replication initiator protein DnaA [Candidatus Paceibacterota bacterium]|nr:chromosomal replication initiator protein DnaA [Candidatus Paceibacterota bacterium]